MRDKKKPKRKRNRAKATRVVKSLIKNDLNVKETAKELEVTEQAVYKQINTNPLVKTALQKYQERMEEMGLNDDLSIKVVKDAMTARRKVGLGHGEDFTIEEEDDHYARLKANEQYIKLKKLVSDAPQVIDNSQHVHFHSNDKATNDIFQEIESQLTTISPRKSPVPPRSSKAV